MITIHLYGRAYVVPRSLDNDAELLAAFEKDLRRQLEGMAAQAGISKQPIVRPVIKDGEYQYNGKGELETVEEWHWLTLPDALHDRVVVPTGEPEATVVAASDDNGAADVPLAEEG